ncbi:MAG: ABC transporter permease, partial [Cyanobacteriota bacterium]|nr:ABC transporter permease [Cyanobacteriota bacterium]
LTYTSIGLRAAAYAPIAQFPLYALPILLAIAIALSSLGAYQFSRQQD